MRRNRGNFGFLVVALAALGALIYFILNFGPDYKFTIYNLQFPILPVFFILLFASLSSLFTFILNNQRRGFLISFFATLYLILRMNKLTHPFFAILILALFITFELLFKKRK